MSDERPGRAAELLEETRAGIESIDPAPESPETALAEAGLFDRAAEASRLLEDDPSAVLASLGLDELPDGSEPESIPAAIARGEEGRVASLRAFLALASFSPPEDGGTDDLEETLERFRRSLDRAGIGTDRIPGPVSEAEAGAEDEDGGSLTETVASAADEVTHSAGEAADALLASAVGSAIDGLDEEVRSVRERLEALHTDDSDDDESREDSGEDDLRAGSEGRRHPDDGEKRDAGEDDSLFGGGPSARTGTAYSTVAPPPGDRPEMRHSTRHSTVPARR